MLVLFLLITLSRSYSASLPTIPDVLDAREVLQLGPPALQDHKPRTRFDIIWTCVSTLFICTWVAIHPNVPPRGEGHVRSVWRRIKLMLWTLVVPELILIWAYRQWVAARHIAELFKEEGWTPAHGYFLIMGGFSLVKDGIETVLDYELFLKLLNIPTTDPRRRRFREQFEIAFPTITAAEIHDKARGDFLSKAIVILQSLWFIVQCIARGKQGLALTELELVTLALVSLNGVMYYFWWDKPLGVKEPVKVYPKGERPAEKFIDGAGRLECIKASKFGPFQRFIVCPFQRAQSSVFQLPQGLRTIPSPYLSFTYRRLFSDPLSMIKQFLYVQRERLDFPGNTYLWFLYLLILWFVFDPVTALTESLSSIATTRKLESHVTHVPTFYAPNIDSSGHHEKLLLFVLPVVAVMFGTLHCIAWNFHFPSHIEQLLWRIGSLAITLFPLLLIVPPIVRHLYLYSISLPQRVLMVRETLLAIAIFLGCAAFVAYVLARLLLLTQAIMLLRKQPESAFYAINWANFLQSFTFDSVQDVVLPFSSEF